MKAILRNGATVEIDTSCLFHDQYNTVSGARIFDKDIARIENDARVNMGRCRYCGAMVRRGEEEKHFTEEEKQTCENCHGKKCFWLWKRCIKSDRGPVERTETVNKDGETVITETYTRIEKYETYCAHKEKHGGCNNFEHRRLGIDWFTPENTFFLKYPGGFSSIPGADLLIGRGFTINHGLATYYKKVGSFNLTATLDGAGIAYYSIRNCRVHHDFRIENGVFYVNDYGFGWKRVKYPDRVPYNVVEKLRKICGR